MVDKEKMTRIRENFSQGSRDYDARIRNIIPRYDEMLGVLVSCIGSAGKRKRVIDLGCGTGALSSRILEAFPDVELVCLDMTKEMLELARERLGDRPNVRYVLSDFHEFRFDGPYDHVVTSLALHHAPTDRDKVAIYQKIFDALGPGGSFFNADLVLGPGEGMQDLYMRRWREFMEQGLTEEEIAMTFQRYRQEDSPATVTDHLRWLGEVGFHQAEVVWKNYNFAVYGGKKK